ncbi:MAG: BACON domain-containing protein [Bacteroidales bacterium]|nr:BACON domain-containing protein [Bacteroidales bacterium]
MKLRNFFVGALAALAFIVGCQEKEQNLGAPEISISVSEMTFDAAGDDKALTVTSTREWKVEYDADWVAVSQSSGKASANPQTVTVSVLENKEYDRSADLVFTIGLKKAYLTVTQAGPKGSADALVVYANDFDGGKVEKVTGSDGKSYWPYLDQSDVWRNERGTGIDNLKYTSNGVSIRSVSSTNNIFFPAKGGTCFSIQDLELGSATSLQLTFDASHGSTNGYKATFATADFKVYVSKDNAKWVEIPYSLEVKSESEFDAATARFTVAGTDKLSIGFKHPAATADAYRLTNIVLSVYEGQDATAVDFSAGADMDFGKVVDSGSGSGDSGNGSVDSTAPANAIFFESFTTSQGAFTLNEVTVPSAFPYIWGFDASYKCMKATAYENATSKNYESESWLISPEIDLAGQTAAYLTFEHAGGYFGTPANEATVWISKDGGEWTNLAIAAADYPTGWSFIAAGHWDLASYLGSKIKIAFKYASTATQAGTWEIRNVAVIAGTYEAEPEPETPEIPEGNTITIKPSSAYTWEDDKHDSYGEGLKTTIDGVTIAFYKNTSTSAVNRENQLKSDHVRIYKGYALIITLENAQSFKSVVFKTTASEYSKPFTVVSRNGTVTQTGTQVTWVGEHENPFIAIMDGSQIRAKEITIVY